MNVQLVKAGADLFGVEKLYNFAELSKSFDGSQPSLMDMSWSPEALEKAYTTGQGIVTAGTTGAEALRVQFLHNKLETVSFDQEDAELMRLIPKKKVPNTTIEWTNYQSYGGPGDRFMGETGSDGNFGTFSADDNFMRQVQLVRYMGVERTISLPAMMVQNIEAPTKAAETGATLEIISKLNIACYDQDNTLNTYGFNGIKAQIKQWVIGVNSQDYGIMYDAGGQPMGKEMLEDIAVLSTQLYGRVSRCFMGYDTYGDTQKLLFPEQRVGEGVLGTIGIDKNEFLAPNGRKIRFSPDPMLRRNQPLVADGTGSDGLPRTSGTADSGSLAFAANPWTNSTPEAVAASTGNWYQNVNVNTDTAALGTAPAAVPTVNTATGGNQSNRLSAGTYYYAVAPVYQGLEGQAWVYGASGAGTITSASGIAVTAGQIVQMDIDCTTPCITGMGTTYPRNAIRWRVYRYGGPGAGAPTSLAQFSLLCEIGTPSSGNARGYDNGMYIPGAGNAYFVTEKKGGADGYFLAQLMPLMKRDLPHLAMANLFAMLFFGTPILYVPRHHIWVRNIGRAS